MENKIIIDEDGIERQYRVILTTEGVDNKKFVVYTNDEKKDGDIICYAALYELLNGKIKLCSIKEDKDWEFVRDLLNSIQNTEE